jgi:hypothetical protein
VFAIAAGYHQQPRDPQTARAKTADVHGLAAAEGMTREAIAGQINIGVASVYRALRAA